MAGLLICGRRAALLVLLIGAVSSACGPRSQTAEHPTTTSQSAAPTTLETTPATTTTTTTVTETTTTVDPGLLSQTADKPSTGPELDRRLAILWQAIVTDRLDVALPLFFPESAYRAMKTGLLPNPVADYTGRLLGSYRLDVPAYHAALGPDPAGATLAGVSVAPADAAWIAPGRCENLVGYWHLPGARLVYQAGGMTRSFAVASLISWRGQWYVVHLGPNPRHSSGGAVDQPALGAGTPGPAGGC